MPDRVILRAGWRHRLGTRGVPMWWMLAGCALSFGSWCERLNLSCEPSPEARPELVDRDEDVYPEGVDCDDSDPEIHPSAEEVCDFIDNNCDGQIDEGIEHYIHYDDEDGDAYGGEGHESCDPERGEGQVGQGGDCDDSDASISPGRFELCDGIDNDCNGQIDDDAVDGEPLHADEDRDGFGDPATAVLTCALLSGWISDGSDCDDDNPDINPSAIDVPSGVDGNCDGLIDRVDLSGGATLNLYGPILAVSPLDDANKDEAGDVAVLLYENGYRVGFLDGDTLDGGDAVLSSTRLVPLDVETGVVLSALPDTAGGLLLGAYADDSYTTLGGGVLRYDWEQAGVVAASFGSRERAARLGSAVAGSADVTGDGAADLLMGAFGLEDGAGGVWIVPADTTGDAMVEDHGTLIEGDIHGGYAGRSLAVLGDTDGDGIDDLAVGAHNADRGSDAGVGVAYLLAGGSLGASLADAEAALWGGEALESAAFALSAAGDVNGDGYRDFLVGAHNLTRGGDRVGGAYVVAGPVSGSHTLGSVALGTLTGSGHGALAGYTLDGGDDLDGDGFDDVIVGALGDDTLAPNAGAVFVVPGADLGGEQALWDVGALHSLGATGAKTGEGVAMLPRLGVAILADGDAYFP